MLKLSVRYGCMLLCGRLPPAGARAVSENCTRGAPVGAAYGVAPLTLARACPVGLGLLDNVPEAIRLCVCAGISDARSVTFSLPPISPRSYKFSPAPWPGCIGALPCMFGMANVDLPSPPYVVPRSEKRSEEHTSELQSP